jgi:hypothetical protein
VTLMASTAGLSASTAAASASLSATAVPEPAMYLLAMGGLAVTCCKRHRSRGR